jgi:Protochlamydia outer membrane protein
MSIFVVNLAERGRKRCQQGGLVYTGLLAFGCIACSCVSFTAFAEEPPPRTIQVPESETQLAKWFAARDAGEAPFEYSLALGVRQDALSWSTADTGANIASEVQWNSTSITQLRGAAKLNLPSDWQLRGMASAGAVKSGDNQDTDYFGNDRSQAFSQSTNQSGGSVRDFSLAVGKKIRMADRTNGDLLQVVPLIGLSLHQQNFTMHNGVQTLPANGPFPGLGNSYDTTWLSGWIGADALRSMGDKLTLNAKGELHLADYSAEANWNLRSDLVHPVSFKHSATGLGLVLGVGSNYRINKNFLFNAALDYQTWKTRAGKDQTNFADGTIANFTLNPVRWRSTALTVGATYQF